MRLRDNAAQVFISYTGSESIVRLSEAIEGRGLRPYSSFDLPSNAFSAKALLAELRRSRFAVVIIDDRGQTLNAAVELGLVLAAGTPVLILAATDASLPEIASNLLVVRTTLDDADAVNEALGAMESLSQEAGIDHESRESALGERSVDLLGQWERLAGMVSGISDETEQHPDEATAVALLTEAFRASGVRAIEEASGAHSEADIVVWGDTLARYVSAPLLVEVIGGRWSPRRVELKVRQLDSFLPANGWALLVLAGEMPNRSELASASEGRRVLAISLPELLAQMGQEA